MKKITFILLALLMTVSCSKENDDTTVQNNGLIPVKDFGRLLPSEGPTDPCYDIKDIYAGQHVYVGTVTYAYDPVAQTMDVTYTMDAGWTLEETHLWVGDCNNLPTNNPGNPIIGQFSYKGTHAAGTTTVNYLVENVNATDCISAHSVVNGPNGENETGWMEGTVYTSNGSWAMYREYNFSQCPN